MTDGAPNFYVIRNFGLDLKQLSGSNTNLLYLEFFLMSIEMKMQFHNPCN